MFFESVDSCFSRNEDLAEFRLAAAARPNLGAAWSEIAGVLIHVGHLDEAMVELRKAEALSPGQTTASGRVSELYLFQGKPQLSLDEESRTPGRVIPIMVFDHSWALTDLGASRRRRGPSGPRSRSLRASASFTTPRS